MRSFDNRLVDSEVQPPNSSVLTAKKIVAMADELYALAAEFDQDDSRSGSTSFMLCNDERINYPKLVRMARAIYQGRKRRAELFNPDLFGEPAWDILLDLFIAQKEGKTVSVTSACIGANVPSTTALRWITLLEKEGLLTRQADESDGRRTLLALTRDGQTKMSRYLTDYAVNIGAESEHG